MKRPLVVLAAVAIVVAAVSVSSEVVASPPSPTRAARPGLLRLPPGAAPGEVVLYGHLKSLARKGGAFELRFDPAWWLTGLTARRAKLEDTGSSDVPNDYYVVDDGHRLLTYRVPLAARATVLSKGLRATRVSVSELAQLVQGRNPKRRRLFDRGNHLGFWIRVFGDTVRSLDQQYQP